MGGCQVEHWTRTGAFLPKVDGDASNEAPPKTTEDKFDFAYNHGVEEVGSDLSSLPTELIGAEGDPLIPTPAVIDRMFHEARATWQRFVCEADALPPGSVPCHLNDPYILLQDVPPLPRQMPSTLLLAGQPMWHISDPLQDQGATNGATGIRDTKDRGSAVDLQTVAGRREEVVLWYKRAITFGTLPAPARPSDIDADAHAHTPAAPSRGHLILTLGWAYILSVRLLEIQRRTVVYTPEALQPQSADNAARLRQQGRLVLNLTGDSVSPQLVRWLCALLSPQPGWRARGARMVPPWASLWTGDAVFAVVANDDIQETAPPSSAGASILLAEFCALYGFDAVDEANDVVTVSPITASFMAALTLPLYRLYGLQPQFPLPHLRRRKNYRYGRDEGSVPCLPSIQRYVTDLNYFMTLSSSPRLVASIVWSVFWQPGVDARLVSPWLAGTLDALRPVLASRSALKLVQVFALRRPRVALWWLGMSMLGNSHILDWVERYLERLEEQEGCGSLATPDLTAFAWSGVPHAFSHAPPPDPYEDTDTAEGDEATSQPIARSDLLWHRMNFNLQDRASIPLAWRPFGHVRKSCIEPDIWPWLERGCQRQYVAWVWWIKENNSVTCSEQRGFQADTGRTVKDVPDQLDMCIKESRTITTRSVNAVVKLEPSLEATRRMVSFCMVDMRGEHDMSLAVFNGIQSHMWIRGWGGFD
ncbi:hypothetical protein SPBR_05697 [Sporothrix brasiliensis 5110]|uniref:Uncharacterized protein n=1 Tax=Sporothrix brasiliensis 5110 TaxID=1398154 RepID=A0A0C2IY49_9PEZI|nr:uncharacterized protein SPBR_05697 [Sporothrix brasiliensis 5110]KIH94031.1 hypothetical protein SPBR_05697 [Sporothrix brasiliensis 5110]